MAILVSVLFILVALMGAPLFAVIAASALWGFFHVRFHFGFTGSAGSTSAATPQGTEALTHAQQLIEQLSALGIQLGSQPINLGPGWQPHHAYGTTGTNVKGGKKAGKGPKRQSLADMAAARQAAAVEQDDDEAVGDDDDDSDADFETTLLSTASGASGDCP